MIATPDVFMKMIFVDEDKEDDEDDKDKEDDDDCQSRRVSPSSV